jgi:uncharacterized membrane-anchored protein YhcB (DUF1043 family)
VLNGKHHVSQIKKNWSLIGLILTIVFGAGVVWAFTERDFVEVQTFEVHVAAESEALKTGLASQKELIEEKFDNMKDDVADLDEDIQQTQRTLEEIKDLVK